MAEAVHWVQSGAQRSWGPKPEPRSRAGEQREELQAWGWSFLQQRSVAGWYLSSLGDGLMHFHFTFCLAGSN